MDIVSISGKQGSGKSTTAAALQRLANIKAYEKVLQIKFAEPLYEIHDKVLETMEFLSGIPRVKKDGELLQYLGTDWGRTKFGPNVWVDILKYQLAKWADPRQNILVIIDDCRFENEFYAFDFALRVRLDADESIRKLRTNAWRENVNHPSETGLDVYAAAGKFDLYLDTGRIDSSPGHCATLIMAQLLKRTWIEKRSLST